MNKNNSYNVSATIIDVALKNNKSITNLQLQKILYYIQGKYIERKNKLLFEEEFVAWAYGPVMYKVWKNYSDKGRYSINEIKIGEIIKDKEVYNFISDITLKLIEENIWKLIDKIHEERPWKESYKKYDKISNDIMKEFFKHA